MTDHTVRGLGEGDLLHLARNLRGADMVELVATYGPGVSPVEALSLSVDNSEKLRVIADAEDKPMFIYGLARWTDRSRLIWACGTPKIAHPQYTFRFLRGCRRQLGDWFAEDPTAEYFINRAHHRNRLHLKWLQWCHAEILPALPYGPMNEDFNQFIIRRTSYLRLRIGHWPCNGWPTGCRGG